MTAKQKIEDLIKNHPIMLFMKGRPTQPQCGFSARVSQILRALQAPFESYDVLSDESIRQGIKEYSNWPTIPQLYVKGEFIGGCDIVEEQFANGELEKILEQATKPTIQANKPQNKTNHKLTSH